MADKDQRPINFTRRDGMRIRKVVQAFERGYRDPEPPRAKYPAPGAGGMRKGVLASALTARSGTVPGTGTFHFRTFDGTNMASGTDTFTVRSDYLTAVATGKVIWVTFSEGVWWLVVGDC